MKKLFLLLFCTLILSTNGFAMELISFQISASGEDERIGLGNPKSPIEVPTVYIEDYTLSFEVGHPDYVLNIKDEDGEVVYTTTVYSTQTEVVLPSTLSGEYKIELVMGNWLFTGYINL